MAAQLALVKYNQIKFREVFEWDPTDKMGNN